MGMDTQRITPLVIFDQVPWYVRCENTEHFHEPVSYAFNLKELRIENDSHGYLSAVHPQWKALVLINRLVHLRHRTFKLKSRPRLWKVLVFTSAGCPWILTRRILVRNVLFTCSWIESNLTMTHAIMTYHTMRQNLSIIDNSFSHQESSSKSSPPQVQLLLIKFPH